MMGILHLKMIRKVSGIRRTQGEKVRSGHIISVLTGRNQLMGIGEGE